MCNIAGMRVHENNDDFEFQCSNFIIRVVNLRYHPPSDRTMSTRLSTSTTFLKFLVASFGLSPVTPINK